MIEEEEVPETDFQQTQEAIQDAYSQIDESTVSILEKSETLKKMKKIYNDRKSLYSQNEKDISMRELEIQNEKDQFKNSMPFQINQLNRTQSEIEEQLIKLEEEKMQLLSKASNLSDRCNSMYNTIQKASEEFKSISYRSSPKSASKTDDKESEQTKEEMKKIMDDIEKITDKIIETKSSLIYFDSVCAQTHILYLREIEKSNKIKFQIYNQQTELFNSIDSQRMDYDKTFSDQKYHENSLQALKNKIERLTQNNEIIKEKEKQNDSKIQHINDEIASKKESYSKLKEEMQIVNDDLMKLMREKKKIQDQIINIFQEKKDQIRQVQKAKEEMNYLIRKERRKNNNHEVSIQHINNISIDFQKEEDQIELDNNALDDMESKLEIKEKKNKDIDDQIKHDKKVLNQAYSDLKYQIIEQEKIETELKYHEIEPIPSFEIADQYKNLEKKIKLIHSQNTKKKKEIQTILKRKKNFLKEKTQLMAQITDQMRESLKLEEQYKEERDKYYVFCKKYHRALVVDQSLSSNINNTFLSNKEKRKNNKKKKKVLVRIMSECGVKNSNGFYVVDKVEENIGPTKREKRLHHFIEKYKEIIDKVDDLKKIVELNLSSKVHEAILKDWDEFIDKQASTI